MQIRTAPRSCHTHACRIPSGGASLQGLSKVLADEAPKSMKQRALGYYRSKRIAIHTNICVYEFMKAHELKNRKGQRTSHLLGLLQRTTAFLQERIKPIYVFDGKPPEEKRKVITERDLKRRASAEKISDMTGVEHPVCMPASKKARAGPVDATCVPPDSGLLKFLVDEHDFAENNVEKYTRKIKKAESSKLIDSRLQRFFKDERQQSSISSSSRQSVIEEEGSTLVGLKKEPSP